MSRIPSWLRRLSNRFARRPIRRTATRLTLEQLEDRVVPSTGWVHGLGSTGADNAYKVAVDANGNSYVVGSFVGTVDFDSSDPADPTPGSGDTLTSAGSGDAYVASYLRDGTFAWVRRLGGASGDSGKAIAVSSTGAIWVTGQFTGTADFGPYTLTAPQGAMFVARLTPAGTIEQALQVNGSGFPQGLAVDSGGNVLVSGMFSNTVDFDPSPTASYNLTALGSDSRDAFVMKLDSAGNFAWARRMGGASNIDWGYDVAADASGNVFVTGTFNGVADFGSTTLNAGINQASFVTKVDTQGTFLWTRMVGGNGETASYGIAVDATGSVYFTGFTSSLGTDFDPGPGTVQLPVGIYVASLDSAGNYRWAQNLNSSPGYRNGAGKTIKVGGDGAVYVTGWASRGDFAPGPVSALFTSAGSDDVFLSKLDAATGGFLSFWHMGGTERDLGIGLALDSNPVTGNLDAIVSGMFRNTVGFDDGAQYQSLTSAGDTDAFLLRLTQGSGAIFGRAVRDLGAEGLAPLTGWTVYLDQNQNNQLDAGEATALTGPQGEYEFYHLDAGGYTIRQVLPAGWTQLTPASGAGYTVALAAGQFTSVADFVSSAPTQSVTFNSPNVPKK